MARSACPHSTMPRMERGGNGTSPQGLRHDHQVADATTTTTDRFGEADGDPAPRHELGPQRRVVRRVLRRRSLPDSDRAAATARRGGQTVAELLVALRRGEIHHVTRGGRGRPSPACAMRVRLISLVPPPIVPCTRSRYSQAKRPSPESVLDAGPKSGPVERPVHPGDVGGGQGQTLEELGGVDLGHGGEDHVVLAVLLHPDGPLGQPLRHFDAHRAARRCGPG